MDLFAGIGGFHAALSALGGRCVYAVEKDPDAARIYEANWGLKALGDVVKDTNPEVVVPEHDVLAAGFPCQPFSKSGFQRGMEETRGTLFFNICQIIEARRPSVVMLENVRNIAGPRHTHEWEVIIRSLRDLGYKVSSSPTVFSPHLLPPELGGRPQVRERVFILATYVGSSLTDEDAGPVLPHAPVGGWDPQQWDLDGDLPLDSRLSAAERSQLRLSHPEQNWLSAWNDFVVTLRRAGVPKLPGFPVWVDAFVHEDDLYIEPGTPAWKANFLRKNAEFYTSHQAPIEEWLQRWDYLRDFPESRRKFEWQAQDTASLDEAVLHFRPSGIRVKRPTYLPALVAITQTSILGNQMRRISTREASRLQGLPEWFGFGDQRPSLTYKQLGNGVNIGAAYHVLRTHILENFDLVRATHPQLALAARKSEPSPDSFLEGLKPGGRTSPRTRSLRQTAGRALGSAG